jgi:hypothetical protein
LVIFPSLTVIWTWTRPQRVLTALPVKVPPDPLAEPELLPEEDPEDCPEELPDPDPEVPEEDSEDPDEEPLELGEVPVPFEPAPAASVVPELVLVG